MSTVLTSIEKYKIVAASRVIVNKDCARNFASQIA